MELISLIGNYKTHEMEKKVREEAVPQKKKSIAFKSSSTNYDDEKDEEDNEELSLLVRNVKKMYHKISSTIEGDGKGRRRTGSYATTVGNPDTSWPIVQISRKRYPPP